MNNYNPNIHHRRSIRLKGYDYSRAGLYFITICCEDRLSRFGKIENNDMALNEFGIIAYNEWAKLPERFPNVELDVFQIMPNHMHGIVALVGAGFTPALPAMDDNAKFEKDDAHLENDNSKLENVDSPSGNNNAESENDESQLNNNNAELDNGRQQFENDDSKLENGQPQSDKGRPQGSPLQANIVGGNKWAGVNPAPTAKSATIGEMMGAYKSLVANECLKIHQLKFEGTGLTPSRLGKIWQRDFNDHIIRNEASYQYISNYIVNNPKNWKDDKFYNQ